ncbi:hypothetical protein LCGC14_0722130 [marine sediment metagenome]|uniref:Uncharacterized protein n=1 Tax=marine sediment metagenome TaxID=412755 RepID=A0A0F9QX52_9ZZZZ
MKHRSRYLKIQEFVRRARKRARRKGCENCGKFKEVGLRGTPRLFEMARGGATLSAIKHNIRARGWYCRKCVGKMDGPTAAATLRDQFPPTLEGEREYRKHCWEKDKARYMEKGWNVLWHDDGFYSPVLPPAGASPAAR